MEFVENNRYNSKTYTVRVPGWKIPFQFLHTN